MLLIAVIWLIIGYTLMHTVAVKLAPSGGIDSIGQALAYVIIWKFLVLVPPFLMLIGSIFMWLFDNHKNIFQIIIASCVCIAILIILYNSAIKWMVYSPSYVARHTQSFSDYVEGSLNNYERAHWDKKETISHYVDFRVNHVIGKIIRRPDLSAQLIEKYIDTFMDYQAEQIPYLKSWDFIPNKAITGNLESCKYESIGTMRLSYIDGTTHNIELSRLWDIDMQFAGLLGGRFK